MRKLWIILSAIVVVIVFVALAIPFGMGLFVQGRYPQLLAQFNTPHLSFALLNFKRGWFHSEAQLQVTLHSAETTLSGESIPLAQFTITQDIEHGPLVLQKHLDGSRNWMFALAAVQNESRADNLIFKSSTIWTMANTVNTALQIKHLLLSNDRQRIEINDLNGDVIYTLADRHFQSQLALGNGALYENNPEKVGNDIVDLVKVMELDNLTTHLDIRKINALWYGTRHFAAQKISIFPYGGEVLTINNFAADLNQSQHGGLTKFDLTNHVDTITSGQFKIDQLQVALNLDNMNTPLLENFAQVFMYGSDFQRFKMYPILVDLFAKGMTANLSQLQFTTSDGPVAMQAQIASIPGDPANAGLLHLLENVNMQASANVPKEWLKKEIISYLDNKKNANPSLKVDSQVLAQHYLDYWQEHHLLVPQDQQVSMVMNYKNGQLLINGEKPTLDNVIQPTAGVSS